MQTPEGRIRRRSNNTRRVALFALVALSFVAPGSANAAWAAAPDDAPDHIIFPTGQLPADVNNIQDAVNAGGTLLLKAVNAAGLPTAFEFGASGRVLLTTDATILGERAEGRMTTIRGGLQPFRAAPFRPVRSAIRGIHFAAPRSAAVFLNFSRGFEFTGNVVTDVVGTPYFGLTKGQAVWVTEFPGGVTGTVTISGNLVERVYADLSYGVAMAGFGAATGIAGNRFRDTTDTAILVVGATQPVHIEDNFVLPGERPFPGYSSVGNGIFVGQGSGAFTIRRNTVVCGNPLADGIALSGHVAAPGRVPAGSLVENNHVTMRGSVFGGITIYGEVAASLIANNRVEGDGAYALVIASYLGNEQTSSTVFRGNNTAGFRSTVADVFFDITARGNVLFGHSGTVVDLGLDNRITGFTNVGVSIGPEIRAAQEHKRELLRAVDLWTGHCCV